MDYTIIQGKNRETFGTTSLWLQRSFDQCAHTTLRLCPLLWIPLLFLVKFILLEIYWEAFGNLVKNLFKYGVSFKSELLLLLGAWFFQNQQLCIFVLYIKTCTWHILGTVSQNSCFQCFCISILAFVWFFAPFVAGLAGVGYSWFLDGALQKADELPRLEVRTFLVLQVFMHKPASLWRLKSGAKPLLYVSTRSSLSLPT